MDGLSQKAVRKPQGLISPTVQGPQTPVLFKIQSKVTYSCLCIFLDHLGTPGLVAPNNERPE